MKLFSSVNRKIKFREQDYIEKNYIRADGKAVIPIYLKSVDDIYMKHDFKRLVLSDAIVDYIEEVASIIPFKYDIVLEFHCPKIEEWEQNKIRKVVRNNFGMDIDDVDYENRMNAWVATGLTLLGILLLVIGYSWEIFAQSVIQEIIFIIGWVLVWDMLEAILFDNNKRKIKRLNKLQLYDSRIEFIEYEKKD